MAIFPGEPGLVNFTRDSPSPYILITPSHPPCPQAGEGRDSVGGRGMRGKNFSPNNPNS